MVSSLAGKGEGGCVCVCVRFFLGEDVSFNTHFCSIFVGKLFFLVLLGLDGGGWLGLLMLLPGGLVSGVTAL